MRVYGGNNMTIRVGIIGRNFVVDWMLAAMEQVPELRPAAIYSRTEETGREFAEKYHIPYGNLVNWEQLRVREQGYVSYLLERIVSLEGAKKE